MDKGADTPSTKRARDADSADTAAPLLFEGATDARLEAELVRRRSKKPKTEETEPKTEPVEPKTTEIEAEFETYAKCSSYTQTTNECVRICNRLAKITADKEYGEGQLLDKRANDGMTFRQHILYSVLKKVRTVVHLDELIRCGTAEEKRMAKAKLATTLTHLRDVEWRSTPVDAAHVPVIFLPNGVWGEDCGFINELFDAFCQFFSQSVSQKMGIDSATGAMRTFLSDTAEEKKRRKEPAEVGWGATNNNKSADRFYVMGREGRAKRGNATVTKKLLGRWTSNQDRSWA